MYSPKLPKVLLCLALLTVIESLQHGITATAARSRTISIGGRLTTTVYEYGSHQQEDLLNTFLDSTEVVDEKVDADDFDPYGVIMWPSSVAVAHRLVDTGGILGGEVVEGEGGGAGGSRGRMLELGCGVGLVGLTCAKAGLFDEVLLTDVSKESLELARKGAQENCCGEGTRLAVNEFDFLGGESLPECDTLVATDILYTEKMGLGLGKRVIEALENGTRRVIIGDSEGRWGRKAFLSTIRKGGWDGVGFEKVGGEEGSVSIFEIDINRR